MKSTNGRFEKGHIASPEEKLKRIEGIRQSWKNRDDYNGTMIISPLYNCWRSFMFTKKGKAIGCSDGWKKYKNFYADMIHSYKPKRRLTRLNKSDIYSFENCRWFTEEEAALLKDGAVKLEYLGEIKTLKEWAIKLDIYYSALRQRYYKGKNYSVEEVLFGKSIKSKGEIIDIKTLAIQKKKDKVSKMVSAYRCKDKKRGLYFNITNEWFTENIITKPCTYCGTLENIGCDRIDNKLGHTITNVIPSCYTCNIVRQDLFSVEEMKNIR